MRTTSLKLKSDILTQIKKSKMYGDEVTVPKICISTECIENHVAYEARSTSFLRPKRRASESSVSSMDSWLSRGSTISNSSSSLSDYFSVLPLELELSIMGTVDQSILDRAHVAQDKRTRSRSLPPFRQNSRTRLLSVRTDKDGETSLNQEGLLSTTLCSTEL